MTWRSAKHGPENASRKSGLDLPSLRVAGCLFLSHSVFFFLKVIEELQTAPMNNDEKELLQLLSTPHLRVKKMFDFVAQGGGGNVALLSCGGGDWRVRLCSSMFPSQF